MSFAVPTDFSQTNTHYEPIPADNHIGVCVGVIDLGTHQESYQGAPPKPVRKVKLQFELPGVERTDGKAAIVSAKYNYSMNEKATFRQVLDGWLGNDWTEKYRGQSWSFLLGIPAMVNVQQGPSKHDPGRISSWIAKGGISKFPKGLPAPKPTRDTFWLDLSERVLPDVLSVWDAEMIRQSAEYKAGGFKDQAPHPNQQNAPANGNGQKPFANVVVTKPNTLPSGIEDYPTEAAILMAKYELPVAFTIEELGDTAKARNMSDDEFAKLVDHAMRF